MSTKKQTNVSIADRLQTLVNDLCRGNAKQFAENADILSVTLYNYLKGRIPKADALSNICLTYSVNLNWLVSGVGDPYISKGGEVDSIPKATPPIFDENPEIADLLDGARRVLTSGNPIAFDAMERNIRYFSHAIEVEKRMQVVEAELAEMKQYIMEMKRQKEANDQSCKEEPSSGRKAA